MHQQYARLVKVAALSATVIASILLILKILAWWHTGSVSLLASLVDSLVDIAASLTNLLVIRYALQPADKDHTFGHGKAESLAALAQSMFICGSALFLFLTGFQHLLAGADERSRCRDVGYGVCAGVYHGAGDLSTLGGTQDPESSGACRHAALPVRRADERGHSDLSGIELVRRGQS